MAEYKGIKGFKVQTVSTDPAASIIATGTWASGGNLNTASRSRSRRYMVLKQHALAIWWYDYLQHGYSAQLTEEYNGTSWTEVNDLNTARRSTKGGTGTTNCCFSSGGDISSGASYSATVKNLGMVHLGLKLMI
jgi:hypothetical protein